MKQKPGLKFEIDFVNLVSLMKGGVLVLCGAKDVIVEIRLEKNDHCENKDEAMNAIDESWDWGGQ